MMPSALVAVVIQNAAEEHRGWVWEDIFALHRPQPRPMDLTLVVCPNLSLVTEGTEGTEGAQGIEANQAIDNRLIVQSLSRCWR